MQYIQDYDEKYPMTASTAGMGLYIPANQGGYYANPDYYYGTWRYSIQPYVKSTQLFACPSSTSSRFGIDYSATGGVGRASYSDVKNYGCNENVLFSGNTPSPDGPRSFSAAGIAGVALLPMVADASAALFGGLERVYNANGDNPYGTATLYQAQATQTRHLGGSNILYADGHVKFQTQLAMVEDPSRSGQANEFDRFKIPTRAEDDRVR